MARRLKVFRTPIGFHDAYVAAPSRKAALAAWGSDADLFARGIAEEVDDAALVEAPLARPGEVIRVARGSAEEHMAALPKTSAARRKAPTADAASPPKAKKRPAPSRAAFDAAEQALADAETRFAERERALARKEAAIAAERKALERERGSDLRTLTDARDDARARYEHAVDDWAR